MEVTQDKQALANDFFVDCDHRKYGKIRLLTRSTVKPARKSALLILWVAAALNFCLSENVR